MNETDPPLKIADFQDQELVLDIKNPSNISYNDNHLKKFE